MRSTRPAGSPANAVRNKYKIQSTTKTNGKHWNAEVINALCRRLPGGQTAVTTVCDRCNSMFYPCFCSTEHRRENYVPHRPILRAPRIVEISEKARLGFGKEKNRSQGNLSLVRNAIHKQGFDTHRCELTLFDNPTDPRALDEEEDAMKTGTVSFRQGGNYAIVPDHTEPWAQKLSLTDDEWQMMKDYLDDDLHMGDLGDAERFAGSAGTVQDDMYHKLTKTVEYKSAEEADADLELAWIRDGFYVQAIRELKGIAFHAGVRNGHKLLELTCYHEEQWLTLNPNIDLPKELLSLMHTDADRDDAITTPWPIRLSFNMLPAGWRLVRIVNQKGEAGPLARMHADSGYGREWVDVRKKEDFDPGENPLHPVLFWFEAVPIQMVSRTDIHLRHQYNREKNVKSNPDRDAQLLLDWGIKSKLTPSQLQFTFKKLEEAVEGELDRFHEIRDGYERCLLQKMRRAVEISYDLKDVAEAHHLAVGDLVVAKFPPNANKDDNPWLAGRVTDIDEDAMRCSIYYQNGLKHDDVGESEVMFAPDRDNEWGIHHSQGNDMVPHGASRVRFKAHKFVDPASKFHEATMKREMESIINDVEVILHCVPLHFLDDLKKVTDPNFGLDDHRLRSSLSLGNSTRNFEFADHQTEGEKKQEHKYLHKLRRKIVSSIRDKGTSHNSATNTRMRIRTRAGCKSVGEGDILKFIHDHIREYFAKLSKSAAQEKKRREAMKRHEMKKIDPCHRTSSFAFHSSNSDGRMSPEEFEKAMYMAGISWLTSEELKQMFDDMDADGSGRLHLGEILQVASQMQEISRKARAYEEVEVREKNRKLTQAELLEEFCMTLLVGDDLSDMTHVRIRVCTSAKPGEPMDTQEILDGHFDCPDACYKLVPTPLHEDETGSKSKHWVHFAFDSPCVVTALATKGDPNRKSWVQKYRLQYKDPSAPDMWIDYRDHRRLDILDGNVDNLSGNLETLEPNIAIHPSGAQPVLRGITELRFIAEDIFGGAELGLRLGVYGYRIDEEGQRLSGTLTHRPKSHHRGQEVRSLEKVQQFARRMKGNLR